MPKIKSRDMRFLDRLFGMEAGYVLDFSDKTMREFFDEEVGINIDEERYRANGHSKAKRLRHFLTISPGPLAGKALRALYSHLGYIEKQRGTMANPLEVIHFYDVVQNIEEDRGEGGISLHDAVERFTADETLEELVAAIERDIGASKPQVALDRLHTYCMKKFAHLLKERGEDSPNPKETLNARAGRYFNPIRKTGRVRPITERIMRSTVEVFELFNGIRNNESLAHDNELVNEAEAQYIFESVVSLLRFLKKVEGKHFGS